MSIRNDKSLGQHWLHDPGVLSNIANHAGLSPSDTVLEIGPGLGTLTSHLLRGAGQVVAIEYDPELARKLPKQFPGKNLIVKNEDILQFDLSSLPRGYKVVANLPYYITSKIIQTLTESSNPPVLMVLLVQKEVAERLTAEPGEYSVLGISAQIFHEVGLGQVVPAELFTPPPRVDSQVVIFRRRPEPLVSSNRQPKFFRLIKAGFSAKRKKLRSSLSGGLGMTKDDIEQVLKKAGISADLRAQDLTICQWLKIEKELS